ncbi:unnamed protein product [Closterium sp. Yama58-4]|nr:unnamed protein product [Closterium sp. Yama58-4]
MSPVQAARAVVAALGLCTLAAVVHTCLTDGSPFRWVVLTPWMRATLVDFYVNVALIAAWVCYKESTWLARIVWVALLICFGSMATCLYVVIQLVALAPSDPLYSLLLREHHFRLIHGSHAAHGLL